MIDEQGLYDIYGLSHVPFWQTKFFIICVSMVAALLLLVLLMYIKKLHLFAKPAQPYWEKIIAELKVLQKEHQLHQDPKVFYSLLTKIVKRYMSIRFKRAFEVKTDKEMVQLLQREPWFTADVPDIRPLFEGITPIKFGKKHQLTRKIEQDIALSLAFVQKTLPKEL